MPTKVARVHAKGMGPGTATTVLPRHSSGSHGCLCDPATAAVVGDANDGRQAAGGRILLHSALLPWRVRGSKWSHHHPMCGPVPWSGPRLVTGIFGRGPGSVPTHGNQPLCHWHGGCIWCRTAHAHDIACGRSGERLCPVNDGGPVVAIFASLMALLGGGGGEGWRGCATDQDSEAIQLTFHCDLRALTTSPYVEVTWSATRPSRVDNRLAVAAFSFLVGAAAVVEWWGPLGHASKSLNVADLARAYFRMTDSCCCRSGELLDMMTVTVRCRQMPVVVCQGSWGIHLPACGGRYWRPRCLAPPILLMPVRRQAREAAVHQ